MKKCIKCGKEYEDNTVFCPNCGQKLEDVSAMQYCKFCGEQNPVGVAFCRSCGNRIAEQEPSDNKIIPGNRVLLIIIGILAVALVATIAVVVVRSMSNRQTFNNKPIVETERETQTSPRTENVGNMEQNTESDSASTTDIKVYQEYFDKWDDTFNKLIISTEQKGELKVYKNSLQEGLSAQDLNKCKDNYDKTKALEDNLIKSSQKTVDNLISKLKKLEKKSSSKSVKKDSEYKKDKKLAQKSLDDKDYKDAQILYQACIDRLNAAKNGDSETASSTSTVKDDSMYKAFTWDNESYMKVCYNYLSESEVKNMDSEVIRYYINTMFAYFGYQFSNSSIQEFFYRHNWYGEGSNYYTSSVDMSDQDYIKKNYINNNAVCRYNLQLLTKYR